MPLAEKINPHPRTRKSLCACESLMIQGRDDGLSPLCVLEQNNEFVDLMPSKSGREEPTMPAQFPDLA